MSDYEQRFGGIQRLVSVTGATLLRQAHVCVVGIGGVGSWTVEALARSGIGQLTLVDLDEVCVTNVNRQVPAVDGEIGNPKVEVMQRRVRAIHPGCAVHAIANFFTAATAETILQPQFDYVVDAIDSTANKCLLIARCREKGLPIVTVGGAGGRLDPTAIQVADLAFSSHDRLLQETRKRLRQEYGFPRDPKAPFHVDAVFSREPVRYPHHDGTVCAEREEGTALRLDCESGFGTASFVTGAFGFVAAGHVIRGIALRRNLGGTPELVSRSGAGSSQTTD